MKLVSLSIAASFLGFGLLTWLPQLSASPSKGQELTKITKKRIPMDPRLLTLCVGPGAVVGPHDSAEVDVFVNEIVLKYRKKHPEKFDYPVGSVFEKRKYPAVGVKDPDIATVMVRTDDKGSVSDWEFSMHSLPEGKPLEPQARISCADCHEKYEARGYISQVSETALREHLQVPVKQGKPKQPLR